MVKQPAKPAGGRVWEGKPLPLGGFGGPPPGKFSNFSPYFLQSEVF